MRKIRGVLTKSLKRRRTASCQCRPLAVCRLIGHGLTVRLVLEDEAHAVSSCPLARAGLGRICKIASQAQRSTYREGLLVPPSLPRSKRTAANHRREHAPSGRSSPRRAAAGRRHPRSGSAEPQQRRRAPLCHMPICGWTLAAACDMYYTAPHGTPYRYTGGE
eukprot:SAG31_NODE_20179_length_581_cov_1.738589_1_plen_163_part_00